MKKTPWLYIALAAIAVIVVYNLTRQTSVSTTQSTAELPGQGIGTDIFGNGDYTVESLVEAGGLLAS
jgi:hypothetical protein